MPSEPAAWARCIEREVDGSRFLILEKDPKRRLHDIVDARIEIDEALSKPFDSGALALSGPRAAVATRSKARELLPWILASIYFVALIATLVGRLPFFDPPPEDTPIYSSSIVLPDLRLGVAVNPPGRFALSPDGRRLALVASDTSGRSMLWLRPLDANVAQPLAGTEGASFPFWSPDSRFIAFQASGKLKKIAVSGGQRFLVNTHVEETASAAITLVVNWTAGLKK